MDRFILVVALLHFAVDVLLLLGTNRLCGYPPCAGRILLAGLLGGAYGAACLLSGMQFLGNALWRPVFLALTAWAAFGSELSAVLRGAVFTLLHLALEGAVAGMGNKGVLSLLLVGICITLVCLAGSWGNAGGTYVPVELAYGGKRMRITALRDTGNLLRDPITGQSVLVVGADVARELTGLTREQLGSPLEAITEGILPGLRLIPYRSVGKAGGMLLALSLPEVKIGKQKGSRIVAFAPDGFCTDGAYQALTGGTV